MNSIYVQNSNTDTLTFKLGVSETVKPPEVVNLQTTVDSINSLGAAIVDTILDSAIGTSREAKLIRLGSSGITGAAGAVTSIVLDFESEGPIKATVTGATTYGVATAFSIYVAGPALLALGITGVPAILVGAAISVGITKILGDYIDTGYDMIFGPTTTIDYDANSNNIGFTTDVSNNYTGKIDIQSEISRVTSFLDMLETVYPTAYNGLGEISTEYITPDGLLSYQIQPGDSVYGICDKYDIDLEELLRLNPWLADRFSKDGKFALIRPGEKLKLPGGGSTLLSSGKPSPDIPFNEADKAGIPGVDPILIDLNNDGKISTVGVENGIYFDHGNDGFAEISAWVNKNDGILAIDKNNDGVINNGNEIFGDGYIKGDGKKATSGFNALADLDSNNDGIISNLDEEFNNIKILKGDGTLISLEEAGIVSIDLNSMNKNIISINFVNDGYNEKYNNNLDNNLNLNMV